MSRLSEILNVEEGQEFEYKNNGYIYKIEDGFLQRKENGNWENLNSLLCIMINHTENIIVLKKPKLTKKQKTAIKGRIAEGTPWAVKDISGEEIAFYSSTPCSEDYYATSINVKMYDFLKVGQAVYLPDLIGDEEE